MHTQSQEFTFPDGHVGPFCAKALCWQCVTNVPAGAPQRPFVCPWTRGSGAGPALALRAGGHTGQGSGHGSSTASAAARAHLSTTGCKSHLPLATGAYLNNSTSLKGHYCSRISNWHRNEGLSLCRINLKTSGFDVSGK